jgi:hypothetical protein
VARPLDLDELVDHFTLDSDELEPLRNKTGATRLGFSVILKFVVWEGRFPRGRSEVPDNAAAHVARQVGVPAGELGSYDWGGVKVRPCEQRRRRTPDLLAVPGLTTA